MSMVSSSQQQWRGGFGINFEIGSVISLKTCFNKEIRGEIMAFDVGQKLLAIKCVGRKGSPNLCSVELINLSYVQDIELLHAYQNVPFKQEDLDVHKLLNRTKRAIDEKRRIIAAMSGGVSPEGQKLFVTINRTISEVHWEDQHIVVYNDIRIVPPYRVKDIKGKEDSKAYQHIRKVVEKHYQDLDIEPIVENKVSSSKHSNKNSSNHKKNNTDEDAYRTCNGHSASSVSNNNK